MKTDIEIANGIKLKPIGEIAAGLGLGAGDIIPYGAFKAKIGADAVARARNGGRRGKLILVTAMNPTAMGEGKTTVSIGLADGIARLGGRVALALREPSLGPCFGLKGGATGGGFSQIAPMADINLHFNGDIHALTAANNLLCALVDNHMHWGNRLGLRNIFVPRALDLNDRALRRIRIGFGKTNAPERDDGFIITVATELMALLCLARDIFDLREKLGDIIIGENEVGDFVRARDVMADGAMAALLKDAVLPNLAQTLEGAPALVHGGPFANIAHGCNSIAATETALGLADYAVTEAGFGADLGGEKFIDIKCRKSGLAPDAAVIVATMRAIREHGLDNLRIHIENMRGFGVPAVIALNRMSEASDADIAELKRFAENMGVGMELFRGWEDGGAGSENLARAAMGLCGQPSEMKLLYGDETPLLEKARTIARKIYRAADIAPSEAALRKLARFEEAGFGKLPVCVAKTPLKLNFGDIFPLDDAFLYAGAGMVVITAGAIMRMPGLPEHPAAENIRIGLSGEITGLF
ncbi:MAG: formate--tetrahydrofolate ligase [Rickettsiales bacterium]|jgi:formate--tetrahydrofolate ligase|nr:formate--tetrahydrofolate ligase [Rickettsiales bacterium]